MTIFADIQAADNERRGIEPKTDGGLFRKVSRLQGTSLSEREWVVRDIIPAANLTILNGDGGTGKSLLAQQLAVAVASGNRWAGREVQAGRALYLSAEDEDEELARRWASIAQSEGLSFSDLDHLEDRSLTGTDALLGLYSREAGQMVKTPLLDQIEEQAIGAKLLVLDTLSDLHNANEIDRVQVRQFCGLIRGLAMRTRCAVVLLAHPSLSGINSGSGTSGSTQWSNSARSRLYLDRVFEDGHEPDPDLRRLVLKKSNYGRVGEEISLRYSDGVLKIEGKGTHLDRVARKSKAERIFLKLLEEFNAQGRRVHASTGRNFAPDAFIKSERNDGVTKKELRTAMEALLHSGRIVIGEEGPPSRRTKFLIERAAI